MIQTIYDIIKAYGGEIKVQRPPAGRARKAEEDSEFIMLLRVSWRN